MELNELCRCGHLKAEHGDIKYPLTANAKMTLAAGHGACHKCNECKQYTWKSFADKDNKPVENWRDAMVISA